MSVWSISAAAVLAGVVVGAGHQEVKAPPAPAVTVISEAAPAQEDSQKVSASFNHAAVSDVMDWLTKNGVSFVADDGDLPKDETITLNVQDQPLDDVLNAVASALGGHWERKGQVRVFRKGEGFTVLGDDGDVLTPGKNWKMVAPDAKAWSVGPDGKSWSVGPDGKGWKDMPKIQAFGKDGDQMFVMPDIPDVNINIPPMGDMQGLEKLKNLQDMPGLSDDVRKEIEEAMKQAQDAMSKNGEAMKESQSEREEAMKAVAKAMEEARSAQDNSGMTDEIRKEVEQAMKSAQDAMKSSGEQMKESRAGQEEARKEVEKAMEQARKAIEQARKEHPEAFGNGNFFYGNPDGKSNTYQYRFGKGATTITGSSFKKFANSLSPEQREENRRQGYIRWQELSDAQRKLLGVSGDGKGWTIKIDQDGDEITVKNGD